MVCLGASADFFALALSFQQKITLQIWTTQERTDSFKVPGEHGGICRLNREPAVGSETSRYHSVDMLDTKKVSLSLTVILEFSP